MKIISKFKDFYDYLAQDYDADIVYSRFPKWVGDLRLRKLYMSSTCHWKYVDQNKLVGNSSTIGWSSVGLGDIDCDSIVFGIYPFVYSTPILKVYGRKIDETWKYPFVIYIKKSFIEELENELDIKSINEKISKLVTETVEDFNKSASFLDKLCEDVNYFPKSYYKKTSILNPIKGYCRKVECQEIFKNLKSPVFIEENELIDFYHSPFPNKEKGKEKIKQYLVDLSFNALDPAIIKYWYNDLCDLNTYNYIENFLWSIKQEPQSEQTNNEKILSHGFDLKTSFRKM